MKIKIMYEMHMLVFIEKYCVSSLLTVNVVLQLLLEGSMIDEKQVALSIPGQQQILLISKLPFTSFIHIIYINTYM